MHEPEQPLGRDALSPSIPGRVEFIPVVLYARSVTEGDENLTRSAPSGDKNSAAPRRAATTTVDPRLEDDATGQTQQSGVRAGWRFRDGR